MRWERRIGLGPASRGPALATDAAARTRRPDRRVGATQPDLSNAHRCPSRVRNGAEEQPIDPIARPLTHVGRHYCEALGEPSVRELDQIAGSLRQLNALRLAA